MKARAGNGCRVMVVDDDDDNRELLLSLLEQKASWPRAPRTAIEAGRTCSRSR